VVLKEEKSSIRILGGTAGRINQILKRLMKKNAPSTKESSSQDKKINVYAMEESR